MEGLSKQQLILVALLISFVTSLATGVVTVSLMNQAPQSVVRTISQVVERAVSQDAAAVNAPVTIEDQIANAVGDLSASVVKLRGPNSDAIAGLGLVMTKSGVVLADKAEIAGLGQPLAVLSDGTLVPLTIVQSEINGDIVFLAPILKQSQSKITFVPVELASPPKLGQTILALGGTSTPALGQGIVTEIKTEYLDTTIPSGKISPGSPLFDLYGHVLGLRTSSLAGADSARFYAVQRLKSVIPAI